MLRMRKKLATPIFNMLIIYDYKSITELMTWEKTILPIEEKEISM